MLVGAGAQTLGLGRTGTGAVQRSSDRPGQLDGRSQCGPAHRGCTHAYSGEDAHAGGRPSRRAQQVGRLQDGLRVLAGLHAQGGHAGGAVALTTVRGQEGQAHGVGDTAGAQAISWK